MRSSLNYLFSLFDRHRQTNELEELAEWLLENVLDCLLHGLFIMKWKKVLYLRYNNDLSA